MWPILIGISILFVWWAVHLLASLPKPAWKKCKHCQWWFSEDGRFATGAPLGHMVYVDWGVCRVCAGRARHMPGLVNETIERPKPEKPPVNDRTEQIQ